MNKTIINILSKINKDLYSYESKSFSKTRKKIWENDIGIMIDKIKTNSHILDLGCGNARLYQKLVKKRIYYTGIDQSKKLIDANKKRFGSKKTSFICKNALNINYKNKFDFVFCLAILHHLPSKNIQFKLIKKIYESLKKDKEVYLSVWNRWQIKYRKYFYNKKKIIGDQIINKYRLNNLFFKHLSFKDLIIPWKNGIYARYIYAFNKIELIKLFKSANFKKIDCYYANQKGKANYLKGVNIIVKAKKI